MDIFNTFTYLRLDTDTTMGHLCVDTILDFLENSGTSTLMLIPSTSSLRKSSYYQLEFFDTEGFESILSDKSNLFRVNNILIDLSCIPYHTVDSYLNIINEVWGNYRFMILVEHSKYIDKADNTSSYDIGTRVDTKKTLNVMSTVRTSYEFIDTHTGSKFLLEDYFRNEIRSTKIQNILNQRDNG